MDIALTIGVAASAAFASFVAGVFATRKKFRSEILRLAVEASKHDFEAMKELDKKFDMPMSVSLACYVSYFTKIEKGSSIAEATEAGFEGMKNAVKTLRGTGVRSNLEHEGLESFFLNAEKQKTAPRGGVSLRTSSRDHT